MVTIIAHFDGRVLVPEQPVDLPRNCPLELHISESKTPTNENAVPGFYRRNGILVFQSPPDAPIINSEDVRRLQDEP